MILAIYETEVGQIHQGIQLVDVALIKLAMNKIDALTRVPQWWLTWILSGS